jgi:hypothetical protein
MGAAAALALSLSAPARAAAPAISVAYQPMVSTGLAAGQPFEAWFDLDQSFDPMMPGYAMPAGAAVRFTFPAAFTPRPGLPLGAVMIRWTQGAVPAKYTVSLDPGDSHAIDIRFESAVAPGKPGSPAIKAIHLRTPEINPAAGQYPISVEFINAGALTGKTIAMATVTSQPVPNIAMYNQLHAGESEDWQRVNPGAQAPVPIDFLVTLPGRERTSLSLRPNVDGTLAILGDGMPVGTIKTSGTPVRLTPQPFGPGYARLGIVEVRATAGSTPGTARIEAALDGGTRSVVNLVVQ